MSDYCNIYLKTDVFLIADVFQKFRKVFDTVYGIDPCHHYSSPNISWDAMWKTTGVNIGLLTDVDQLLFCERVIRE